jgi:hypothetical protein
VHLVHRAAAFRRRSRALRSLGLPPGGRVHISQPRLTKAFLEYDFVSNPPLSGVLGSPTSHRQRLPELSQPLIHSFVSLSSQTKSLSAPSLTMALPNQVLRLGGCFLTTQSWMGSWDVYAIIMNGDVGWYRVPCFSVPQMPLASLERLLQIADTIKRLTHWVILVNCLKPLCGLD